MLFKFKKNPLLLAICVISMLLSPALVQAEDAEYESGSIAASRAADQRAALAKKAEARKKRAEERQKAAEAQKTTPAQEAVEVKQEAPAN